MQVEAQKNGERLIVNGVQLVFAATSPPLSTKIILEHHLCNRPTTTTARRNKLFVTAGKPLQDFFYSPDASCQLPNGPDCVLDVCHAADRGSAYKLTEEDIPGTALGGRDPGVFFVAKLKGWLAGRGASRRGRKAELVLRVTEHIATGLNQQPVDPNREAKRRGKGSGCKGWVLVCRLDTQT